MPESAMRPVGSAISSDVFCRLVGIVEKGLDGGRLAGRILVREERGSQV